MKEKTARKKVVDIVFGVILAVLCLFVAFTFVTVISGKIPNLFGYGFLHVKTGSMEPAIKTNSVIMVRFIDKKDFESLEEGKIIAFYDEIDGERVTITHRLIENHCAEGYVITKGDFNSKNDEKVSTDNLLAVYVCDVRLLTAINKLISTIWGFLLVIAFPCLSLILLNVVNIVQKSKILAEKTKNEKRINELKEEAIKEYLASKKADKQ